MNERIRALAEKAGGFPLDSQGDESWGFRERALERFAELVMLECINRLPLDMDTQEYTKIVRSIRGIGE